MKMMIDGPKIQKHRYSRKELILAIEGLRVEIAGLKNHVRQLSKDLRTLRGVGNLLLSFSDRLKSRVLLQSCKPV
jgi:hypothetical protein